MVGGDGDQTHVLFDQHGLLDRPVPKPVKGVGIGVVAMSSEALFEPAIELFLFQGHEGLAGLGRDPEHRSVGTARGGAVDGYEGV